MHTPRANWILFVLYLLAATGVLVAALLVPSFRSIAYAPVRELILPPPEPVVVSVLYSTEKEAWLNEVITDFEATNPTIDGHPVQIELEKMGSWEINAAALDNNFSVQQLAASSFDDDIATMQKNIAAAANDNEKKEFEEALKSLQTRKAQMKNVGTLLSRFEAQLTGANNTVDSVVTGIVGLKGRDAKQIESKIPPLLQVLQTEQNELQQFDTELEKTSLI
jgi:hypothetical protein